MNRRYSHMLTRGVNEIQLFVYIRTESTNFFIIKKGGLLWQDHSGVVGAALMADHVGVAELKCIGRTMFPVVVYVCSSRPKKSLS